MALSFCTNWETTQYLNPDLDSFQQMQQADLSTDFFNFHDNFPLSVDTLIDPFFDPDEFFYWESYNEYPPCFSPFSDSLIFPPEEFNSCNQLPKRQRIYEDHYLSSFPNDILSSGYLPSPLPLPELMVPLPEFSTGGTAVRKQNGGSLSAQSIAARERRRKITEKTQELGKLIPGGNKMNTAEMFQAAFNYVKYLQAQVGILQSMGSFQVKEESVHHTQELQTLIASPTIQEKLYSEEKCLVPKQFLQDLANDKEILSKPLIFKDIDGLIQNNTMTAIQDKAS